MKTILVVDDEYALVESLVELCQDEGYRVVSAANGKDGLVRLVESKPDLLITDFMMPIADGGELVRGARALPAFQSLPIIMMSSTLKSVALAGGTLEVSAFLKKPFGWSTLLTTIIGLIGPGAKPGDGEAR
jgi:CheY-like chemotaxis protein